MAEAQKLLQDLSDEFQKLQSDLQTNIQAREKLEAQQQENKGVQKEFAKLDDDDKIYKLVGPVLLKQEKTEAVMAVDGRLQFIEKEIARIEKKIDELKEVGEKKRTEIYQLQSQLQQSSQQVPAAS